VSGPFDKNQKHKSAGPGGPGPPFVALRAGPDLGHFVLMDRFGYDRIETFCEICHILGLAMTFGLFHNDSA